MFFLFLPCFTSPQSPPLFFNIYPMLFTYLLSMLFSLVNYFSLFFSLNDTFFNCYIKRIKKNKSIFHLNENIKHVKYLKIEIEKKGPTLWIMFFNTIFFEIWILFMQIECINKSFCFHFNWWHFYVNKKKVWNRK